MAFGRSDRRRRSAAVEPVTLKILVAGGFGVGKTTLVGAVSEIKPLRTEERLTEAGRPLDDLDGVEAKTTTTVAMDFGRITVNEELVLYLFGTPGQDRFWFLWDELARGALGAVVLADTRRLADSFAAIDYFERRGLPFTVAVNCFDGADRYPPESVRDALDLDPQVPVMLCDARLKDDARDVLVSVVEHAMEAGARRREPAPIPRLPPARRYLVRAIR
ncbi:GTP-binding protein [Streptomyces decoyicus]|uniref:GTP-binding protein n=1 Tax=Streptomyces decoyicus TaxID=249567 RepID=UPI0033A746EF